MIDLFIDTSLSYIRIALLKNNKILDYVNEKVDKDLSKLFDVKLNDLFSKNNLDYNDVDKIYAVTGPGSFTGIRVGLTFVKILAWSLKKDVIPVSELQVLASTSFDSKYVVPLIDARRGFVYAGLYDCDLNPLMTDRYISLKDLFDIINLEDVIFVSHDSFDFTVFSPDINFLKVMVKNCDSKMVNAHVLQPNYLKNTEAEENFKRRLENDKKV